MGKEIDKQPDKQLSWEERQALATKKVQETMAAHATLIEASIRGNNLYV